MIPFTRVLKYGNTATEKYILNVDYSTAPIGSTGVPDKNGTEFILRSQVGTISPHGGVVAYDSSIGSNVLDCTSSTGFFRTSSPVYGTDLDFSRYNAFEIKYRFQLPGSALQVLFETGTYNTRRIYGFTNTFNQYASNYNQVFVDWGANYARLLPAWTRPNDWDTITIQFRKNISITIHSELNNKTETFPWYDIVSQAGQYCSLFGSYVDGDNNGSPFLFTGKIQYIRIKEI